MVGIGGVSFGRGNFDYSQQLRNRSFERLGSGKRINSAADDAANLATVQQFLAIEAGAARGIQNLADGQSLVRTAEGALEGTSELLGRMRELVVQGKNGTLNDADRATIQEEYDQLAAEVTRISESTEFNGKKLLNGDDAIDLTAGDSGAAIRVDIGGQSADDLAVSGSISDAGMLDRLDAAINSVSGSRAKLGVIDKRLGSQTETLRTTAETTAAARSRIEDADFAAETSNLTRANILGNAQIALQTQGRRLQSNSVLRLLS